MKKRTKRKLWKFAGKAGTGLLKLLFFYPVKGLWYVVKKGYGAITKKSENKRMAKEQGAVKKQAAYDPVQEILLRKGTLAAFEEKLFGHKSTIGIILGARGTGKSALGMRLLENFKAKTAKNIYAMGFQPESLPSWMSVIQNVSEIENNAVILIDEGGIQFSSRRAMSDANTLLSEILLISRHKDLSVIFITQNSANLEINAIRQADYLLLKPSSLLQKDLERKIIKDIYEKAEKEFEELKGTVGLTYVYSDMFQGFVVNSLPSFWSEKVSKGFAKK